MHDRIEAEASAWAVRHPLAAAERVEIAAWLERDPRHQGALLRAMAGLSAIEHALTADSATASPTATPPRTVTRRWVMAGTGGAIAAAIAGYFQLPRVAGQLVTTARGEIRRLPLEDGSIATINTGSELRIVLDRDRRQIDLARGQAWFQVAKDRTRPFVVDAGIAQARAVGTAFSVTRGADGVQVAVTEGVVAVWPSKADGMMTILEAGQYANFMSPDAAPVIGTAPEEIERALAWRNGEIALENNSLGEAVASFNRYNQRQIILADPGLANEKLVGLFKLDKPENFASMLSATLDIDASISANEIRLTRKKSAKR